MAYLPTIGATAGATGSSLLGQASDVLSAPRRALWSMLGMPEDGSEVVAPLTNPIESLMGWDEGGWLTKGLGIGAEMVADPLNLIGVPLGAMAGRLPRALQIKKELGALAAGVPEVEAGVNSAKAAMLNAEGALGRAAPRVGPVQQQIMGNPMAMEAAAARPAVAMQPSIDDLMEQSMAQLGPRRGGMLAERQMSGPSQHMAAMVAEKPMASPMAMEQAAVSPALRPVDYQAMLGRRAEGARSRYGSAMDAAGQQADKINALLQELAGVRDMPIEEALALLGGVGGVGAGMMYGGQ